MELSSYDIISQDGRETVVYKNLYLIDGAIYYNSPEHVDLPLVPTHNRTCHWRPMIKSIPTQELGYIDLACYSTFIWLGNIGHCFWDALYPIWVSMVRAGFADRDFHPISNNFDGTPADKSWNVVDTFCGRDKIDLRYYNENIRIGELVCGTLDIGNVAMNQDPVMYGQVEFNSMGLFRDRMLAKMGIEYSKSTTPKCIIVDNKRYSKNERTAITSLVSELSSSLDIEFINWANFKTFKEQLEIIAQTDIHITGPGTGMMYMPFLKPGSVNVNLGFMEHTQTNTARPNIKILESTAEDHIFPSYMEQSTCCTANYVSTIYYDRFNYNEIEKQPLATLINSALTLHQSGQIQLKNYYKDMEVFIEYCDRVENTNAVCRLLRDLALFPEFLVHEHPHLIHKEEIDLDLLRKVKTELGFDSRYDIRLDI